MKSDEPLRSEYERLKVLYQVGNTIHSTLDPQEALDLIVSEAVRITRASSGSIVLVNPHTGFLEIQAAKGLPEGSRALRLRIGEGITGWVASHGKSANVGDAESDPRYFMLRENVCSELAAPFEVEEQVQGVLNVDSDRPNAFTESDQWLLEELAAQAAKVIEKTWQYEQLRLKARLFETVLHVSQAINSSPSLDETLSGITRESCRLIQAAMSSLLLLDETGAKLRLLASHGASEAYRAKPELPVDDSFVGFVVRRQKPMQVENVQASSRYQNTDVARQDGLVSLLSLPLVHRYRGHTIGALNVYTDKPHRFSNEEIHALTALAELSAIAIEKARLHEQTMDYEEQLHRHEKLSALGLLAAEVAHEIRNPLTVIKMLFHSLDLRFSEDDPRANDVRIIDEKMVLLNRIVEQALDFARSTEPVFTQVRLNGIIEDLGLLVRHKLRQQNIQLKKELEESLPELRGDEKQLAQAFLNLTLNAMEAMPDGGQLTVRTRHENVKDESGESRECVIAEFQDTGGGMTEDQKRKAFTSLLNTTKRHGTGLGLAIVSRVVETHRGRVEIESAPGQGTCIRIWIPLNER